MTGDLETELKRALALRAESVPPEAVARLAAADYRPRTRRTRVRLGVGSGVAAVVATIITLAVGVFGPSVPSAFASWSPAPTPPADGQVATAISTCTDAVVAQATQSDAPGSPTPYDTSPADWNVVVTDPRGQFTLVVLNAENDGATNAATCLTGGSSWPAGPQLSLSSYSGAGDATRISSGSSTLVGGAPGGSGTSGGEATSGPVTPYAPATGEVGQPSTNWMSASNYEVAVGAVATGVATVSLNLADGQAVTASVANGEYAAWWPGYAPVASTGYTTTTSAGS